MSCKINKICTAEEAAALVKDSAVLACSGCMNMCLPDEICMALERRFLGDGHPLALTCISASGAGDIGGGDGTGRGFERFAHDGMIKRMIIGHNGANQKIMKMQQELKTETYNLPYGIIEHIIRARAGGMDIYVSKVGLDTFVDPRRDGGKNNSITTEDIVHVETILGETYLVYDVPKIDVALIRGTYADAEGNLCISEEATPTDVLVTAMAAHASGGIVLCQVKDIVPAGSIKTHDVKVPGIFIDKLIISENPEECHRMTQGEYFCEEMVGLSRPGQEMNISFSEEFIQDRKYDESASVGGNSNNRKYDETIFEGENSKVNNIEESASAEKNFIENKEFDEVTSAGEDFKNKIFGELSSARKEFLARKLQAAAMSPRKAIAKRAAMELEPGQVINLGLGIPELIASVAYEEGIFDEISLSIDSGVIGGLPAAGLNFGASYYPSAFLDTPAIFDFYNSGFDATFLGFAECDAGGNVNSTLFVDKEGQERRPGSGGLVNLTQGAKTVVFCGTMTADGFKAEVKDGRINIISEGSGLKFVNKIRQQSFSAAEALKTGKRVLYVTERCVFELTGQGIMLIEIAEGLDAEKDILPYMEFKPIIADDLKVIDPTVYRDGPMKLR